jgi:hypothetical protein
MEYERRHFPPHRALLDLGVVAAMIAAIIYLYLSGALSTALYAAEAFGGFKWPKLLLIAFWPISMPLFVVSALIAAVMS